MNLLQKGRIAFLLLGAGSVGLVAGCAHTKNSSPSNADSSARATNGASNYERARENTREYSAATSQDMTRAKSENPREIIVKGIKLQNTQFDYPITVNSRVEHWVDYFTGRGRKHFSRYLERSEYFIPYIKPILKANGMPEDLVYLAMIESGFNNHARSHAKAVGPWQFISATGKRYGLAVNWWVDERRDTRKSTLAAVNYLKDLYQMMGSWELASASYNAGENKLARAVRRFGTRDFWTITRHRFLRPETRDYVPKIIAAALIAKNPTQFGFPAPRLNVHEGEVLAGDGEVVKVEKASDANLANAGEGTDGESIKDVLRADDYENAPEDPSLLAILSAKGEGAPAPLSVPQVEGKERPLAKAVQMPHVSKKGEVSGEDVMEFEVQSPADLLKVARAAELSYQTVKSLNPEVLRWCTPPGSGTFRIKLPISVKDRFLQAYNHESYPRQVQFLTYKVRKGETLAHVARHFGIRQDPLVELNRVSTHSNLRVGTRVLLPMPNDRSRTLASLEVRDPPERRKVKRRGKKVYRVGAKDRQAARGRVRAAVAVRKVSG